MSVNAQQQQAQPTSSVAIKHRQLAHLAAQFQTLATRTEQLERLTVTTAEQASYMRLLGVYHSSWFMAAGREMIKVPDEDGQPVEQQQQ